MIFEYPEPRSERVHGPEGYASYESFRPWLRDEFTFPCVYCLKRETWGQVTGEFELDHFEPQSIAPDRTIVKLLANVGSASYLSSDQCSHTSPASSSRIDSS